ncbi:Spy/CpxP family protein refolding chaperone [Cyanobacterium sp. Dongsha4]|uniref:Spy/CpxP family protein refolding chaperone n=1 Tax=Cyanobacterium sp. DS4 TaxID=2878255 RepID=UPI002E809C2D|nr:Spy/CpxP family protein refolding chaperone [Cyanobacterium sp. Dongsha4]WVL00618.1 Spy/CpxP family protein refolding chaperone [Cyanobacterium sp. Dongsha4]
MNNLIRHSLIFVTLAGFGFTGNASASNYEQNPNVNSHLNISTQSRQIIAQKRWGDDDKEYKGEKLIERLNLTTEQRNQMTQIRNKYQPQFNSLREQIRTQRNTLSQMMRNNQSESQLRSQHQKIVTLDQQIHNLRFESMLEMRAVLTPEQRQEWANMMADRKVSRQGQNR